MGRKSKNYEYLMQCEEPKSVKELANALNDKEINIRISMEGLVKRGKVKKDRIRNRIRYWVK